MKKIQKRYIVLSSILLILLIIVGLSCFPLYQNRRRFFPRLFPLKTGDIQVFGKPNAKADVVFPATKPAFSVTLSSLKSPSLQQQSVIIYGSGDSKKTPVFQRQFYADGFRGKTLTYSFASDAASFRQSGSLGTIGCSSDACNLPWSNFYVWDSKQQAFVLDNASHKDVFAQLLTSYQTIDEKGCSLVSTNIVPNQTGMTFTQLYAKYPTLSWYCSTERGILPTSLTFFLKAKQAVQAVIDGNNVDSADIQASSL